MRGHGADEVSAVVRGTEWRFGECDGGWAHDDHRTAPKKPGYRPDAKLLVIHGGDLGMGHAKKVATLRARAEGGVTSVRVIMRPHGWRRCWI